MATDTTGVPTENTTNQAHESDVERIALTQGATQVQVPAGENIVRIQVTPGEAIQLPFAQTGMIARLDDGNGNLAIKVGDITVILQGYINATAEAEVTLLDNAGAPVDVAAVVAATDPNLDIATAAGPAAGDQGTGADNNGGVFAPFDPAAGLGGLNAVGGLQATALQYNLIEREFEVFEEDEEEEAPDTAPTLVNLTPGSAVNEDDLDRQEASLAKALNPFPDHVRDGLNNFIGGNSYSYWGHPEERGNDPFDTDDHEEGSQNGHSDNNGNGVDQDREPLTSTAVASVNFFGDVPGHLTFVNGTTPIIEQLKLMKLTSHSHELLYVVLPGAADSDPNDGFDDSHGETLVAYYIETQGEGDQSYSYATIVFTIAFREYEGTDSVSDFNIDFTIYGPVDNVPNIQDANGNILDALDINVPFFMVDSDGSVTPAPVGQENGGLVFTSIDDVPSLGRLDFEWVWGEGESNGGYLPVGVTPTDKSIVHDETPGQQGPDDISPAGYSWTIDQILARADFGGEPVLGAAQSYVEVSFGADGRAGVWDSNSVSYIGNKEAGETVFKGDDAGTYSNAFQLYMGDAVSPLEEALTNWTIMHNGQELVVEAFQVDANTIRGSAAVETDQGTDHIPVFVLHIDPSTGTVTLIQLHQINHGDTADSDDSTPPLLISPNGSEGGEGQPVTVRATDYDGDFVETPLDVVVRDDGPSVCVVGRASADLIVDESVGTDGGDANAADELNVVLPGVLTAGYGDVIGAATDDGSTFFTHIDYGTDGPGSTVYALTDSQGDAIADGKATGLYATGHAGQEIQLFTLPNGVIEGRIGGAEGDVAFALYIDPTSGAVAMAQYLALDHGDNADHDQAADPLSFNFDVHVSVVVTDADGDQAKATSANAVEIAFEDDGPKISLVNDIRVEMVLDESVGNNATDPNTPPTIDDEAETGAIGTLTGSVTGLFDIAGIDFGSDGAKGGIANPEYQLILKDVDGGPTSIGTTEVATNLSVTDPNNQYTNPGNGIVLVSVSAYQVNGYVGSYDGQNPASNVLAFVVRLDKATGALTVSQFLPIEHGTSGDTAADHDDIAQLIAGESGGIFVSATVTDGDGDTMTVEAPSALYIEFEDDGPRSSGWSIGVPGIDHNGNHYAILDEDFLDGGNEDKGADGESNRGENGDQVLQDGATAHGYLSADFGTDGPAAGGGFSLNTALSVGDDFGANYWGPGQPLETTSGHPLVVLSSSATQLVVGYNDGQQDHAVFTLTLSDENATTKRWDFVLNEPLAHSDPASEDNIYLDFNALLTDGDGDTAAASIHVMIDDDSPIALNDVVTDKTFVELSQTNLGTVEEFLLQNDLAGADGINIGATVILNGGVGSHGGKLEIIGGNVWYTAPNVTDDSVETFSYQITDNDGDTSTANVSVTVTDRGGGDGSVSLTITGLGGYEDAEDAQQGQTDADPQDQVLSLPFNFKITVIDAGDTADSIVIGGVPSGAVLKFGGVELPPAIDHKITIGRGDGFDDLLDALTEPAGANIDVVLEEHDSRDFTLTLDGKVDNVDIGQGSKEALVDAVAAQPSFSVEPVDQSEVEAGEQATGTFFTVETQAVFADFDDGNETQYIFIKTPTEPGWGILLVQSDGVTLDPVANPLNPNNVFPALGTGYTVYAVTGKADAGSGTVPLTIMLYGPADPVDTVTKTLEVNAVAIDVEEGSTLTDPLNNVAVATQTIDLTVTDRTGGTDLVSFVGDGQGGYEDGQSTPAGQSSVDEPGDQQLSLTFNLKATATDLGDAVDQVIVGGIPADATATWSKNGHTLVFTPGADNTITPTSGGDAANTNAARAAFLADLIDGDGADIVVKLAEHDSADVTITMKSTIDGTQTLGANATALVDAVAAQPAFVGQPGNQSKAEAGGSATTFTIQTTLFFADVADGDEKQYLLVKLPTAPWSLDSIGYTSNNISFLDVGQTLDEYPGYAIVEVQPTVTGNVTFTISINGPADVSNNAPLSQEIEIRALAVDGIEGVDFDSTNNTAEAVQKVTLTVTDTGPTVNIQDPIKVDEDGFAGANSTAGAGDDPEDDSATQTGNFSITAPIDAITSITLSTTGGLTGLETLDGKSVRTVWDEASQSLIGFADLNNDGIKNDGERHVFTLAITNPSTGAYKLDLHEPLKHSATNGGMGSNFEDDLQFNVNIVAKDDDGTTGTGSVTVIIDDDVPTANPDGPLQVAEDTPLEINVFANDEFGADGVDTDNNPNVAVTFTQGAKGVVTYDAVTGLFTYSPNPGAEGGDTFTYTIKDKDGDVSTATVTVNIAPDSTPQLSAPQNLLVDEDGFAFANKDTTTPRTDEVDAGAHLTSTGFVTVNFGNDQPANPATAISLLDTPGLDGQLQTLDGQDVTFAKVGNDLVGTVSGGTVEVIRISVAQIIPPSGGIVTYNYQAELKQPIKHPDGGVENTDILTGVTFEVTDKDNDTKQGSFSVTVYDDVPSLTASATQPDLIVDETTLGDNASASFASVFAAAFGADGIGADKSYVLGISSPGAVSGLVDTATNQQVFLFLVSGQVVGKAGVDAAAALVGSTVVFTVSVDSNGLVALDQVRAVTHDTDGGPGTAHDDPKSLLSDDLVTLTATITDKDGDTTSAIANIGQNLVFEDDGPSLAASGVIPTLTVDESNFAFDHTLSFAGVFAPTYGADGAGSVGGYALGINAGVTGLVDTLTGNPVVLSMNGATVEGKTNPGGDLVFTVSVDADGNVTLNQLRAVMHPTLDPNEPTSLDAANLITLTATVTDKDGDTNTATANIAQNLVFRDDGPAAGDTNFGSFQEGAAQTNLSSIASFVATHVDGGNDQYQSGSFTLMNGATPVTTLVGSLGGTLTLSGGNILYTPPASVDQDGATSETFTYRIADKDGDIDTGVITVSVTDGRGPVLALATGTVDEEGLPGGLAGTPYGDGSDAAGESKTTGGTLGVTLGSDPLPTSNAFNFIASGTSLGGLQTLDGTSVVMAGPFSGGSLSVYYGFKSTGSHVEPADQVFVLILNRDTGEWSFELKQPVKHPTANTEDDLSVSFGVSVTDIDGTVGTNVITVTIDDDGPVANNDPTLTITTLGAPVVGTNLLDNDAAGADGGKTVIGIRLGDEAGAYTAVGVGGTDIQINAAGNVGTPAIGTLHVNPDGSWTFTQTVGSALPNLTFSYQMKDADGDTDTASFQVNLDAVPTITVTNTTPETGAGEALVDEDWITGGNKDKNPTVNLADNAPGDDAGTNVATGTWTISGGDPTVTKSLTGITDGVTTTGALAHDGTTIKWFVDAVNPMLLHGKTTAGGADYFTLEVKNDGTWQFTLIQAIKHGTAGTEDNVLLTPVALTATDADGDTATAYIKISIDDDMPAALASLGDPVILVDETNLATDTTVNFKDVFTVYSSYGADGAGTVGNFTLGVSQQGQDSGLRDTATGNFIYLFLESGQVVGREGVDATAAASGQIVFVVTADATTGDVTLDQKRAIVHEFAGDNPDTTYVLGADNYVTLTATITDKDGDSLTATATIGRNLQFKDDGPTISLSGAEETLTVDETVLATNAVKSFAGAFTGNYGADLAGTTTYALGISATGANSGLVDTGTNLAVNLFLISGQVVGSTATSMGGVTASNTVFKVLVDASGNVTLDQQRAIHHGSDGNDPDSSKGLLADNLVTLTATIKDKDNDTASAKLDIGSNLMFKDDGPSISVSAAADALVVDESFLGTNANANFADNFTSSYGADGAGTLTYALGISATGANSGLVDTATNQAVVLSMNGSVVEGRTTGGLLVFTVSVNSSGLVTLDQIRSVVHPNAANPDDSTSLSAANLVTLTATITDKDNDSKNATIEIGQALTFKDDGPTISVSAAADALVVDESFLGTNANANFADNFTSSFGADGAGTLTYALGISAAGANSGLVDTATNQAVVLSLNGGVVEGRTTGGVLVFTVSVNSSGVVTLDQIRSVVHPNAANPDDSTSLSAANLVTLTATITDKDNDSKNATIEIGQALTFKDDGPSISVSAAADALVVDESNFAINANANFADNFTSSYGADGAGTLTYALGISAAGANSGLVDTATNQAVVLSLNGGVVEGRTTGGVLVFTVSVNSSGLVTLDQVRSVVHPTGGASHDEGTSLSAADLITLTATITDKDNDTQQATINIGQALTFKDDGPNAVDDAFGSFVQQLAAQSIGNVLTQGTDDTFGADGAGTPQITGISASGWTAGGDAATGYTLTQAGVGVITVTVAGAVTFAAAAAYNGGSISFDYTIKDKDGDTDTATANFSVTADPADGTTAGSVTIDEDSKPNQWDSNTGNDTPVAKPITINFTQVGDTDEVPGNVTINDLPSGAVLTYLLNGSGATQTFTGNGTADLTISWAEAQTLQLRQPQNDSGTDYSIGYTVAVTDPSSGKTANIAGSIGVIVNAVADYPTALTASFGGTGVVGQTVALTVNGSFGDVADADGSETHYLLVRLPSASWDAPAGHTAVTLAAGNQYGVPAGTYFVVQVDDQLPTGDTNASISVNVVVPAGAPASESFPVYAVAIDSEVSPDIATATELTSDNVAVRESSATLTINAKPSLSAFSAIVDEDGLSSGNNPHLTIAQGNGDDVGGKNSSSEAVYSDTVAIDWNGNVGTVALNVDQSLLNQILLPSGVSPQMANVSGNNTDHLIIRDASNSPVIDITINSSGQYTVTLLKPIKHDNAGGENNDAIEVNVTATNSAGSSTPVKLTVTIDDDAPSTVNDSVSIAESTSTGANVMFILDVSGSMGWGKDSDSNPTGGNPTRLTLAKNAILATIDKYVQANGGYDVNGNNANVKFQLVLFSGNATNPTTVWVTASQTAAAGSIQAYVNAAALGQNATDYDAPLNLVPTAFNQSGKILGGVNVSYFLSDGAPNEGEGSPSEHGPTAGTTGDSGIGTGEESTWTTFLGNNGITSYAIGIGPSISVVDGPTPIGANGGNDELDPIAYDGKNKANTNAVAVADLDKLGEVLGGTVGGSTNGNVLSNDKAGADGWDNPAITKVKFDGVDYFDGNNDGIITITTDEGTLTIYTKDVGVNKAGDYGFNSKEVNATTPLEFTYTVTDDDGDTADGLLTVTVVNANKAPVITSGDSASVAENVSTSFVVYDANATDGDNDTLTYSISGGADKNLFDINGSTGEITFKNSPNFEAPADNGGNNVYDIVVDAFDGVTHTTKNVTITVTNVNEAPVNSVGNASGDEDTQISITTLSVSDVDAGSSSIQVVLSVPQGTLTITNTSGDGVTVNGVSNGNQTSATLTLVGSQANINAALQTVKYNPVADFHGNVTLTMTTDDLGNSGSGGAKNDSDQMTITVNDIIDPLGISVDDVVVTEGNTAQVRVYLSEVNNTGGPITVRLQTVNQTAGNDDYTETLSPSFITVTIPNGQQQAFVNIGTVNDTLDETDETFGVVLVPGSVTGNGFILDGTATVTITDNDTAPVAYDNYGHSKIETTSSTLLTNNFSSVPSFVVNSNVLNVAEGSWGVTRSDDATSDGNNQLRIYGDNGGTNGTGAIITPTFTVASGQTASLSFTVSDEDIGSGDSATYILYQKVGSSWVSYATNSASSNGTITVNNIPAGTYRLYIQVVDGGSNDATIDIDNLTVTASGLSVTSATGNVRTGAMNLLSSSDPWGAVDSNGSEAATLQVLVGATWTTVGAGGLSFATAHGAFAILSDGTYTFEPTANIGNVGEQDVVQYRLVQADGEFDTAQLVLGIGDTAFSPNVVNVSGTNNGTSGTDVLLGNDNNNTLNGGEGNDRLEGRGGNDTLTGGNGIDYLFGGDGHDTLIYDNQDKFDGGSGFDRVQSTASTFTFNSKDGTFTGIEMVDLGDTGNHNRTVVINAADVLDTPGIDVGGHSVDLFVIGSGTSGSSGNRDNVDLNGFTQVATGVSYTDDVTGLSHTYNIYQGTGANTAIKVAIEQGLDMI